LAYISIFVVVYKDSFHFPGSIFHLICKIDQLKIKRTMAKDKWKIFEFGNTFSGFYY
jgi:hypothetical protein